MCSGSSEVWPSNDLWPDFMNHTKVPGWLTFRKCSTFSGRVFSVSFYFHRIQTKITSAAEMCWLFLVTVWWLKKRFLRFTVKYLPRLQRRTYTTQFIQNASDMASPQPGTAASAAKAGSAYPGGRCWTIAIQPSLLWCRAILHKWSCEHVCPDGSEHSSNLTREGQSQPAHCFMAPWRHAAEYKHKWN